MLHQTFCLKINHLCLWLESGSKGRCICWANIRSWVWILTSSWGQYGHYGELQFHWETLFQRREVKGQSILFLASMYKHRYAHTHQKKHQHISLHVLIFLEKSMHWELKYNCTVLLLWISLCYDKAGVSEQQIFPSHPSPMNTLLSLHCSVWMYFKYTHGTVWCKNSVITSITYWLVI